jgi:hypothetical protein
LTKEELKDKLGEGSEGLLTHQPTMFYEVMDDYCRLALTMNNGKVEDSFLWVDN